jgi:phosphoglycolate phosphatase-like HAD superfamily hydrolase
MLVLFDLDGTLLKTDGIDWRLYLQAFADVYDMEVRLEECRACRRITDRGVAEELLERRLGRSVVAEDVRPLHERFVALLHAALPPPSDALQVPGAAAILDRLRGDGHTVAIATGGWDASARLKLACAGIRLDGIALTACDECPDRESIMTRAMDRAGGIARHGRVVYVGDAAWDVAATHALALPFVGVDYAGTRTLERLGIKPVLRDFSDAPAFLRALDAARPPTTPTPSRRPAAGARRKMSGPRAPSRRGS